VPQYAINETYAPWKYTLTFGSYTISIHIQISENQLLLKFMLNFALFINKIKHNIEYFGTDSPMNAKQQFKIGEL
jgi:hypothetical protein